MQAYVRAHGISQHTLRRWRDLIDANEVEIDWRTHLHPVARPLLPRLVLRMAHLDPA